MALIGSLSIDIIATEFSDNVFCQEKQRRGQGVALEQAQIRQNGQKLNLQADGRKMGW